MLVILVKLHIIISCSIHISPSKEKHVLNMTDEHTLTESKLKVTPTTRSKVKSRSHYGVVHLQPKSNVPTTNQLPTLYSFRDIAQTKFSRSSSLHQDQRSNQDYTMTLHTYIPEPMSQPNINFLHLTASEILPGQIFKVKVTTARSNLKSRSHHDTAHLQPPANVPTKYQLPTPYSCREIAWERFYRSRSLQQGQRSHQGHTITLHTYIPQPMFLPSINFLHLTFSEI